MADNVVGDVQAMMDGDQHRFSLVEPRDLLGLFGDSRGQGL